MAPWFQAIENLLVELLLRTPGFHRGVEKVARTVHRVRHGLPPEDLGGTRIDSPSSINSFFRHFNDEIKAQLGRAEAGAGADDGRVESARPNTRAPGNGQYAPPISTVEGDGTAEAVWRNAVRSAQTTGSARSIHATEKSKEAEQRDESAEAIWREAQRREAEAPKESFMQEYMDALRKQIRKDGK